ncbi:DUF3160 domain-containing protein [Candidatus Vampirococcus lugosii]|uniref:DUF3160 domain-containing protein n=1 Tax=Candidatus Vampirococcus lugosii TaxID=2789015 RepID=A0ABS5QM64_9BACT|nr:hypothetical protein [Candidatus Vampirococcus lugosii]
MKKIIILLILGLISLNLNGCIQENQEEEIGKIEKENFEVLNDKEGKNKEEGKFEEEKKNENLEEINKNEEDEKNIEEKEEVESGEKENQGAIRFENEKVYDPNKEINYSYTWQMEKPSIDEMNNFQSITKGFNEKWTKQYNPNEEVIDRLSNNEKCKEGVDFINIDNNNLIKTVSWEDFSAGKDIELSDHYEGNGYFFYKYGFSTQPNSLNLSGNLLEFFKQRGWVLLDPQWQYINYEGDGDSPIDSFNFNEEWVAYLNYIGGQTQEYRRYPYNTLFVTSDLLLHMYYTLFSDNLKYYEQAFMRKNISEIANVFYDKFLNLYQNEDNEELKLHYEFLLGYWAIASSLLIDESELLLPRDHEGQSKELKDDNKMSSIILNSFEEKISILPEDVQDMLNLHMKEIIKSETQKANDIFLKHYYPSLFTDHNIEIIQDYTQFQPRSHYTTNSLLKTYFMGMKFLMRQKMYFLDQDLSKTALIQANNIDDDEKNKFMEMNEFVRKLIGEDDDVNINDLAGFIEKNNFKSDLDIINNFDENIHTELKNLKQQSIISTSYNTEKFGAITEEQAHSDTVGFVFFGEKATIDAWLHDQLTAGSAEKESIIKTPIVSSSAIAHILAQNDLAGSFAGEFLKNMLDENYVDNYFELAQDLQEQVKHYSFKDNIYNKWLDTLNYLFIKDENSPYFVKDELYQQKNLITYLGSYMELKHATLLYVKQVYAELGGGGLGGCKLDIQPPSLPVPKGYIEPNIDLIDRLISLSKDTKEFYDQDDKFDYFIEYLEFVRGIAVSQTKNEKISDEDFEKLRLYYIKLKEILIPNVYVGLPLQKEQRGSIIADIFTSGEYGALYNAIGRPQLILLMINDINGPRIVVGPVYTPYEFYGEEHIGQYVDYSGRLTDENWQNSYDQLSDEDKNLLRSLPFQDLYEKINKGN